jgi:hypothetical protein
VVLNAVIPNGVAPNEVMRSATIAIREIATRAVENTVSDRQGIRAILAHVIMVLPIATCIIAADQLVGVIRTPIIDLRNIVIGIDRRHPAAGTAHRVDRDLRSTGLANMIADSHRAEVVRP